MENTQASLVNELRAAADAQDSGRVIAALGRAESKDAWIAALTTLKMENEASSKFVASHIVIRKNDAGQPVAQLRRPKAKA